MSRGKTAVADHKVMLAEHWAYEFSDNLAFKVKMTKSGQGTVGMLRHINAGHPGTKAYELTVESSTHRYVLTVREHRFSLSEVVLKAMENKFELVQHKMVLAQLHGCIRLYQRVGVVSAGSSYENWPGLKSDSNGNDVDEDEE